MNKKVSYIEFERRILFNLVGKYRDIVENKKTDSNTVYRKQQIWLRITTEYNRHPNVRKRLTKQLKRLWENSKARAKKSNNTILCTSSTSVKIMDNSQASDGGGSSNNGTLDVPGFAQIFDDTNDHQTDLNGISDAVNDLKTDQQRNKRRRRMEPGTSNSSLDFNNTEMFDQFISPVISAKLKKLEDSTEQQREIHNFSIQREQLQIQALQDQLNHQAEIHSIRLERERELHDLKLKQEREAHAQRLRNEQELHQLKLAEYNKVQTASYPLIYK